MKMARILRKQKYEIGLSPDELLFIGDQKVDNVLLRIIDYDTNNLEEVEIETVKDALKYQQKESITWLNIDGVHDKVVMKQIAEEFMLDELMLSDVMNTHARPKAHDYDNCIFLSVKMLQQEEQTGTIKVENLSIIVMDSV